MPCHPRIVLTIVSLKHVAIQEEASRVGLNRTIAAMRQKWAVSIDGIGEVVYGAAAVE